MDNSSNTFCRNLIPIINHYFKIYKLLSPPNIWRQLNDLNEEDKNYNIKLLYDSIGQFRSNYATPLKSYIEKEREAEYKKEEAEYKKEEDKRCCPPTSPIYCSWKDGSSGCVPDFGLDLCGSYLSEKEYNQSILKGNRWNGVRSQWNDKFKDEINRREKQTFENRFLSKKCPKHFNSLSPIIHDVAPEPEAEPKPEPEPEAKFSDAYCMYRFGTTNRKKGPRGQTCSITQDDEKNLGDRLGCCLEEPWRSNCIWVKEKGKKGYCTSSASS